MQTILDQVPWTWGSDKTDCFFNIHYIYTFSDFVHIFVYEDLQLYAFKQAILF